MSLERCMWSFGLCSQCLAFDSMPVTCGARRPGLVLGKALTNSVVLASYFSSLSLSVFILKQTLEVRCGGMCSQSNLLEGCSKRIGFKVIFDLIKSWLKTKTLK